MPTTARRIRGGAVLDGASRAVDIAGRRRKRVVAPRADEAIAGYWRAVGADIRQAMRRHTEATQGR